MPGWFSEGSRGSRVRGGKGWQGSRLACPAAACHTMCTGPCGWLSEEPGRGAAHCSPATANPREVGSLLTVCCCRRRCRCPPLLGVQFLAGLGWRQEHVVTRGQMGRRLRLNPELCAFGQEDDTAAPRSLFLVASVA